MPNVKKALALPLAVISFKYYISGFYTHQVNFVNPAYRNSYVIND